MLSVIAVLATLLQAPAAQAATAPAVTVPAGQFSGVGNPVSDLAMTASGGTLPLAWSATNLPPGLTIDALTGVIKGTPTTAGTYAAKVTAKDAANLSNTASFSWTTGTAPVVAALAAPGYRTSLRSTAVSGITHSASGATTPYVWSATGLPTGLTINSSTGAVTGTPTANGSFTTKVTATAASKIPSAPLSYTWDVADALAFTAPATQQGTIGQATSLTLSASSGTSPYTWTVTGLPAGLTATTAGVISGTPTTAATSTVSATVKDVVGRTLARTFSWVVAAGPSVTAPTTQNGTTGAAITNLTVTAAGGTSPYTWTATGLPAGLAISTAGVISGTPTTAGSSTVTLTAKDANGRTGSTTFTWNVAGPLTFTAPATQQATVGQPTTLTLSADGGTSPYTWTVTGLPAGLSATTAGVISGTPTAAATTTVSATVKDAAGRTLARTFSWVVAAGPSVTAPTTQNGTTGAAITNLTVTATGGTSPYTWTATGLPAGLAISTAGVISGTPTTAGSSTVTLTAKDANGRTGSTTFTWNVAGPLTFTAPVTQQGTVGVAGSLTLSADGGTSPYTWTVTGLPAGLSATTTGVIAGTPTTAATTTVSATVKDAAGRTLTRTFTWAIAVPVAATDPGAQTGTVGLAGTLTLTATGGTSPYTWTATGLPSGLAVTSGGVLSGTPTAAGATRATATVTDNVGRTSSVSFTITVTAAVAVTNPGEQNSTVGISAQLTLAATGGAGTYTWKADSLPAGLTLDTVTGVISGTPTTAMTGTVKITATDSSGTAGILNLSWTIVSPTSLANPGSVQGTLGIEVSQQLTVTGGKAPYTWTAAGLPAGLTLAAGTGLISGTPTRGTTTNVTVTITDILKNTSTVTFSFVIAAPALTLTAPTPNATDQGQPVAQPPITVTESAGPLTWTADGLPDGLTINSTTGVITGTARSAGTFTVTVAATSDNGRAGSTSFPWQIYAAPATGPTPDSGTANGLGPDVNSGGVTVLGGYAYTVVGLKVVRYDVTAGKNAPAQTVAGSNDYGCGNASSGSQARFYNGARVIGTDGSLIYVADFICGLRVVDPATGATRTIQTNFAASSIIAGHYLYTADNNGRMWRYNLQSGQTARLFENIELYGMLAADDTYLWAFNNSNNTLNRFALDGSTASKTFPLPGNGVTAARSASDYVYFTDNRNLLSRISKTDGSLQIVAGDGAHNDDLLYNTTGIAADSTYLYTAGDHGLTKLTSTVRTFTPPATSPVVDSGTVNGLGPDVNSGGVTVLGGYAYTVVGLKVVRYDVTAGKNAPAQTVAGSNDYGCSDASSGSQARFYNVPRVIGTDGSLIYVADFNCGLRAVNPNTGTTRTLTAPYAASSIIAGHYLYTADNNGRMWRYNLQSGQTARLFENIELYGMLAADDTYLWAFNNSNNTLNRFALDGSTASKTFPLPGNGVTAARSAGDYVYFTDNRNLLSRISKTDGSLQVVAGDGAHDDDLLYNTTGIAADSTYLYTAGDHGLAKLTSTPRVFQEPADHAAVDFGDVRPLGADVNSGGIAVLGGYAYTVVGAKVVRYDLAAGATATAQSVAGSDGYGCGDAGNGSQARFSSGARVIGTDGSLIYVADFNCALRAVNPNTGATRTVPAPFAASSTIAGNNLYTADSYGRTWRYNLQSGQTTRMFENIDMYGVLAADNSYLWGFNNSDNKLYRLALDGSPTAKTFPLPGNGVTTAQSAGTYIYYTDNRNLLSRINKADGSLQIVAGDGAHGGLLHTTSGIATDGKYLYTSGEHGLAKLTSVDRTFASPAEGPVLDSGMVTRTGPDRWALGMTVLDGFAYIGMGTKVVRVGVLPGKDPTPTTIAGSDASGCDKADMGMGAQARFYNANIIGNDGELIYINDPTCGLRTVKPADGTTTTIGPAAGGRTAVAGRNLYSADSAGKISRYDLGTGVTTRVFDGVTMNGPLAADDTYLWGFDSAGSLRGLALNGNTAENKTFSMPNKLVFAALSVGNYIYFADGQNLLSRISKTDGSQQIVAGDGAHNDDLLSTTVGIAADNTNLYTAGQHGLYVISKASRDFTSPIADGDGPKLGIDSPEKKIANLPDIRSGVTVLGWYAYTASGSKVSKTNIYTGETTTVAGGYRSGCGDANTGDQAMFYSASVVGYDGSLIYVSDSVCGLRAVNPATGSTRTLQASANQRSSIAGEFLYTIDQSNTLYQYGLKSGITNKVRQDLPAEALMAAFESGVFIVNDQTRTTVLAEDTGGKQVGRSIGTISEINNNLRYHVSGSYMAYADNALYVMAEISQQESQPPTLRLARIDAIGAMTVIGESLELSSGTNAGFAMTKTDIYRLNNTSFGTTDMVRTHTGGVQDEDPNFQVDLSLYVEKGTAFVPTSHAEDQDQFSGQVLFWDAETGLCQAVCQGVRTLAREYYDRAGEKEEPWLCELGVKDCTVDDYERFIIYKYVDEQRWYDHGGNLLTVRKRDIFTTGCTDYASSSICAIDLWASENLSGKIDDAATVYDVYDLIRKFLRGRNGVRQECLPFNSFRGDTPVLMADGSTTAIQDIRPGQLVLAGDPSSQTASARPVTELLINTDTDLTDLTLADGSVIHTTAHHPFWTPENQEWTDAQNLVAGTTLSSTNGITTAVTSVRTFTGSMTMYNLTVDRIHTYYVIAGNTPILVHNFNCPRKIDYDSDDHDLSRRAADFRRGNGLWDAEHNVAVARVRAPDGTTRIVESSSGPSGHSEKRIIDQLKPDDVVVELYSERKPCPDSCDPMLEMDKRFDEADITYSVDWHTRKTELGRAKNQFETGELSKLVAKAKYRRGE
ncbi:putative Ig domain-containing protein [Actinoplanes sp. L3-i22]|uniref:putative Ig domain-containing protein n=1 Tax=Actinoplanes sp. L3-i22 TaxID=2836373 RepID=UPI001C780E68|nr:putative Ig domain-containing protein [Actinoplanes sp. L3-i22]BCY10906.1 hypothetical protein L3i22_059940 [Actinoplanes sp. L3-i22]